ncbi:MAG: hypothetical protein HYX75_21560 [Acidobacteria bacterium]|nr:hypothetical protein [Acidobacteriota bacterium]
MWLPLAAMGVLLVYMPAFGVGFYGDDFEWLQSIYGVRHNPWLLLSPANNSFFRPLVKLSYFVDFLLFGTDQVGFAATTVAIHISNVILLGLLVRMLGRSWRTSAMVAFLWGSSALNDEVLLSAACRPDSISFMFMLLSMVICARAGSLRGLAWPMSILCAGFAAGSKESWVILPLLVSTMLWLVMGVRLIDSVRRTVLLFGVALTYTLLLVGVPVLRRDLSPLGYATWETSQMVRKAAYMPLKYVGLGEGFQGTALEIGLVLAVLTATLVVLHMLRAKLALFGLTWMLIAIAPTIPIHYLPNRYHYVPLAGLWIAIVAIVVDLVPYLSRRIGLRDSPLWAGVVCWLFLHTANQTILINWDIRDMVRYSEIHALIVDAFEGVRGKLGVGKLFLFRNDGRLRMRDRMQAELSGSRKLLYAREGSIWQLIRFEALAEFSEDAFDYKIVAVSPAELRSVRATIPLLVFTDEGFRWDAGLTPPAAHQVPAGTRAYRRVPR